MVDAAAPEENGVPILGGEEDEDEEDCAFPDFGAEDSLRTAKPKRAKLLKIPGTILNLVGAAIKDFDMIKDGDRVMVALSGGKDSLTLVHILRHFQSVAPIKFDIGAVTVDPMVVEYQP